MGYYCMAQRIETFERIPHSIYFSEVAGVRHVSTVEIVGQSRNETGVRSEVVLVWVKARNICAGGRSMGSKELETESRTCL